jgi:magnesium transporter
MDLEGVPTDGIASIQTRRSMQARRSLEPHRLSSGSGYGRQGDHVGLIHAYDEENGGFGLTELTEDSEDDPDDRRGRRSFDRHIVASNSKR